MTLDRWVFVRVFGASEIHADAPFVTSAYSVDERFNFVIKES